MPPDHLLAVPRVGSYHVLRKIGEGGMGAVYEAERADDEFHKRVAIKTIARGADRSVIVSRFRRERQILAELQHPNIAALLDGGVTETGTPYFVMEYVDGQSIDAFCASKQLTIAQRLDLMQQVCHAVHHAPSASCADRSCCLATLCRRIWPRGRCQIPTHSAGSRGNRRIAHEQARVDSAETARC